MSILSQPIQNILIKTNIRKIGDIEVNVVINENTNDTLQITKQPVQQGASITDHAYMEPTVFSTQIYLSNNTSLGFSNPFETNNPLAIIYKKLLDLQISRVPFSIITPKRIYPNMLMASLSQTTDKNTESCLAINASFQEIIIVSVSTTTVPRIKQKLPGSTGATQNAGKRSALFSGAEGIGSLFGK